MASTYTLNNGIELIGTGEQSGTWGDTTNTNLELLDTALDGQVTITAASAGSSGSPNSLPISDGSASNGRNRLVNITSGTNLGSTVYYQLTPNDAEKIIYIRNSLNTQDLIVFQGTYNSSNDYVVPNGTTAVIFFNGAGSGAVAANVFNNAHFDALNVVGQAKITTGSGNTYPTASTSADELIISNLTASAPSGITIFSDNGSSGNIFFGDEDDADNGRIVYDHSTATGNPSMAFSTSATEAMHIDSSQRVLIKQTSNIATNSSMLQVFSTGPEAAVNIHRGVASSGSGYLQFQKSRNTTAGSYTIVSDGDSTGNIIWRADDGTTYDSEVAWISAVIDGTPGVNDTPGRLVFRTTADGAATSTERMRITNDGFVGIGGARDADTALHVYTAANAITPLIKLQANVSTNDSSEGASIDFVVSGDNSAVGSRIIGTRAASGANMDLRFHTARDDFAMLIDTSQRVLIGVTSARTEFFDSAVAPLLQVESNSSNAAISITRNDSSGDGPSLLFGRARGTAYQVVQEDDRLGRIPFQGADGTDFEQSVSIDAYVDGTPGASDMPGRLAFSTTPDGTNATVERMRIDSNGNVGIGVVPENSGGTWRNFEQGGMNLVGRSNNAVDGMIGTNYVFKTDNSEVYKTTAATSRIFFDANEFRFQQAASGTAGTAITWSEAMRIDSSQRVLIGATSNTGIGGHNAATQIVGSGSYHEASLSIQGNENNSNGGYLGFSSSRGTTAGSTTIVQDDDTLGQVYFAGADGTDLGSVAAAITAQVDGTPGSNDMPGRLMFATAADGSASLTERMRITNVGNVGINSTSPTAYGLTVGSTASGSYPIQLHAGGSSTAPSAGTFSTLSNNNHGDLFIASNAYVNDSHNPVILNTHASMGATGIMIGGNDNETLRFFVQDESVTAGTEVTDAEAMRIDGSQRVLMGRGTGATSTITNGWWNGSSSFTGALNIQNVNDSSGQGYVGVALSRHSNNVEGNQIGFAKSRGTTANSKTVVQENDTFGLITFQGADGSNLNEGARILAGSDGTAGSDDMPGRIQFYTTADGAASPTERMRISNSGHVVIAGSSGSTASPTSLMGDMNAYLRVSSAGAQIGTLVKYSVGPSTTVDGAVFKLRTGTNGNAAYLRITCTNYQGARESIFFANNASGSWNLTEVNVADYGGSSPNFAVTTGTTNPTVTVSLNNTSYSGGFLDVSASPSWELTLA